MTENSRSQLILETVKILIWPSLIVSAALWLGPDLKEILKSRTWKIGIIEVGDRISNLENSLQDELLLQKDYLNKILANSADADKVKDYASSAIVSIEAAQKGVRKAVQNIQEVMPQGAGVEPGQKDGIGEQRNATGKTPDSAKGWETLGFDYVLDRHVTSAIEAFSQAEKIWPDYHNVAEIRKLLIQNRNALQDKESGKWQDIYQQITGRLAWGVPLAVREKMKAYLAAHSEK